RPHGKARAMAEAGRLMLPAGRARRLPVHPVTALRIAIIVAVLATWEAVAASGLLYRDVVPSLVAISRAPVEPLSAQLFFWHLGTTFYEIGIALVIGGLSGLVVGIALGGSKLMEKA